MCHVFLRKKILKAAILAPEKLVHIPKIDCDYNLFQWGYLVVYLASSLGPGEGTAHSFSILGKSYTYRNDGNNLVGLLRENQLFEYWVEWQ